MCEFRLKKSQQPKNAGDQFTVAMDPALPVGCTFSVAINGQQVQPQDRVGGLKVIGFGGAGTASFEALGANPIDTITITVQCNQPQCGVTKAGISAAPPIPIEIGPGSEGVLRQIEQEKRDREKKEHERDERDRDRKEEKRERQRERGR